MALNALAAPAPPQAPAITNGTYSVTPSGCTGADTPPSCSAMWIEEQLDSQGQWQWVDGEFVDKPPGTYIYRTAGFECDGWWGACSYSYSALVSVQVIDGQVPVPEALDLQLNYQYSVSYGNVVGDSGTDLLIERTSGPASGNGAIDAVILQQTGTSFQAVVPNSSQRNSSIWQASSLPVSVEDMNADGAVDVALQDVAHIIPGAKDQIVFASASATDPLPKGVRAFDDTLRGFTANLIDYMANERFFIDNATWTLYTSTYRFTFCPGVLGGIDYVSISSMLPCTTISIPNYDFVPDYSAFDDDAVDIWQNEVGVALGTLASAEASDRIAERIEDVFEVSIGGWDMREIFGNGPGIDDTAERRGLEAFLAILGIGNAYADEVEPEEVELQGPRANDVIHIVARYVFGRGWDRLHTSTLYKMPVTGIPSWYSGFDSDDGWLNDGTLVARTNDPKDSPLLMRFTIGEVIPPASQSRAVYFFGDLKSAHDHYRNLPDSSKSAYDAIPEFPCGGCNGRNSNGYTNGLSRATNGRPDAVPGFNFDNIIGWEYPVEAHYFGR